MMYLTGAGCGDFSLLTLKAKYILEKADCVLYDRLIDPRILSFTKKECEKIYVGKANHHHSKTQDEINELLVQKNREYACVVRLKGGDPYVFGRGSEEALYLFEHQVAFEVIPGISSAIGGCEMAGIPVTHRGVANGVRVMSAHSKNNELSDLDFDSMAHTSDTLVFLMGLSNLERIVTKLLMAGKDPNTKIALLSHAAQYQQKICSATLATILELDRSKILSPTLIVVGEVVQFQTALAFQEQKVLFGKRYLLATLTPYADVLWQFEEAGAKLELCICGECEEIEKDVSFISLKEYSHIVFTSRHGVEMFFRKLFQNGFDARALTHCKLCAIGKKTAAYLLNYGCCADSISDIADSEHFAKHLEKELTSSSNIVIVKAQNHHGVLVEHLKKVCNVSVLELYKTLPVAQKLTEENVDGILFTSSFCVDVMMDAIKDWSHIYDTKVYAIGNPTAQTLKAYGFTQVVVLAKADHKMFIKCVEEEELRHV